MPWNLIKFNESCLENEAKELIVNKFVVECSEWFVGEFLEIYWMTMQKYAYEKSACEKMAYCSIFFIHFIVK